MNAKSKKILILAIGTVAFLILGVSVLNYFLESKLKNHIENISENVKIQYEAIQINSLKGSVDVVKPRISVFGKTTHEMNAQIQLEHFSVSGFSYWKYLIHDKITIDDLLFNQPTITYYHNDLMKSGSYKDAFKKGLKQIIQIESLKIHDAHVEVYNVSNDSLLLKTENVNFKMEAVEINPSKEKKPIIYKDFKATSNDIFYKLNDYEDLFLEHMDFRSDFSKLRGIRLKTKYSKEELSNQIAVERDYFNLTIDSLEIKNQDFGLKQDSLFYFKSKRIDFYQPNIKVFRDKLIADDLRYKPLYSKMLRDLNVSITLNSVFLINGFVSYTEKVKSGTQGGKLLFSKLNAEIKNLSNTYKANEAVTSANIKAIFMDDTPINVQWDFDVNNTNDTFIYKAEIGKLNADSMNQFMEPNLNVRLDGQINKVYFTIDGNDHTSHIDLKVQYDDFDIVVLKESGKEKNKLLSSLVNLFVSKDSDKGTSKFRHGSKTGVERDKTKSVFNYLWLNIKEGLSNAMTGSGNEK